MFSLSFFGSALLDAGLVAAFVQCLLPFFGYWRKNNYLLALARSLAFLQSFLIANAFLLLIIAFLTNDFSIAYVARNSHPSLPFFYRLTAVWGAHEGSFLLWIFLLDVWTVALCFFSKAWEKEIRGLTLALLGLMSFCFLLFLIFTSHPFEVAVNGLPQDLNPLLQDPGFFIHPPMLYAGYVGFSVVFAITMAFLVKGGPLPHPPPQTREGTEAYSSSQAGEGTEAYSSSQARVIIAPAEWAGLVRPWILAAWSFLTIGITLGSWWAYHVLGWGGFWFWDPVENASLLPWLAGAALLHLVIVVERQQRFLGWALILAILTFSLSILGTFLVRSGVLISVHSFAHDPSRGLFLLLLLAFVTGSALAIYSYRSLKSRAVTASPALFSWSSREAVLLLQSILLFTAMATVLLGTLYPLIIEASGLGALSVGPPYFNRVLFPLLVLCLLVMGLAPLSQWGTQEAKGPAPRSTSVSRLTFWKNPVWRRLLLSLALGFMLTLIFARQVNSFVILNLSLVFWVCLSLNKVAFKQAAMALAHTGFALVILSIVLASAFSQEREVRLQPGETVTLGPYVFEFLEIKGLNGPNFKGVRASFAVLRHNKRITYLYPEKRIYSVRNMVMTKVDIYPAIFHDLYLALGEPLSETAWSLRLYYKPFVRWIWLGGLCIAMSGFLSLLRLAGRKE